MLYNVNASLQYKIFLSKQYLCSSSVGRDWDFLRQLLDCTRMENVQAAFPTTGSSRERAPARITTTKGLALGGAGGVQS